MSLVWVKESVLGYLWSFKLSTREKLGLAVLTGISFSILAGYLLRQRRKKYKPVAPKISTLHRASTFQEPSNPLIIASDPSPQCPTEHESSTYERTPPNESTPTLEETDYETGSVSSDDSFHSTVDELLGEAVSPNTLYLSGVRAVSCGDVSVRTDRTEMLQCDSQSDFLAKVFCIRLAFDYLVRSPRHRSYFVSIARSLMSDFLLTAGEDPQAFCEKFDELLQFMHDENSWAISVEELSSRRVGAMNVYDIGVDFILLDAFDDLERPPSAFVSVLQNQWITTGMKRSALSAALWSVVRAKRGMLKHKDGFMARFYALSETISPSLAWGFLGTDDSLKATCTHFKAVVLQFLHCLFSLEHVRYTSVAELAEDVLRSAQEAADSMRTFHTLNQSS